MTSFSGLNHRSSEPTVSIVIVSWNVKDCLLECLKSVFAHLSRITVEVFVIDNHSTDGSVEAVRRNFPEVTLVANSANVGFAAANNQGIQESRGEYVLLLNPDTLMLEGSLAHLLQVMDSKPEVGAAGPKLLNQDGTIQYWCARSLPLPRDSFFEYSKLSTLFPQSRLFGRYLLGYWDHCDSREVECLSGACLFLRRKALDEVGALDEGYPLYTEDTDWCRRARDAGWTLYYCADARVIHIGQQSSSQNRGPATVSAVYGVYRYHRKFNGRLAAGEAWLLLSLTSVFKMIAWGALGVTRMAGRERARNQARAYWEVCKLIPDRAETRSDRSVHT